MALAGTPTTGPGSPDKGPPESGGALASRVPAQEGQDLATGANGGKGFGARFWGLWGATAISSSGDGLLAVGLPLLAFTITRSPLAIAAVTADQRLCAAVASLPAGVAADRFDRRTLMLTVNILAGTALVGLVVLMSLGAADLVAIYVAAAVLAVCDTTYQVAFQASVPDVVTVSSKLPTAYGRMIGIAGAGDSFVGPAIGGILFSVARRVPFIGDAASFYLASALVGSSVPGRKSPLLHAGAAGGAPEHGAVPVQRVDGERKHAAGWTADLSEGVRVFSRDRVLKLLAASIASGTFAQSMVFGLMVVFAERTLKLGSTGYGLFCAGASLLGVGGSFLGGRLERRLGASGVLAAGLILAAISYIGLSFTRMAVLAAFVFGLQEFGVAIANVGSVTTRQRLVPRHLFGRVSSVHRLVIGIAAPIGALAGGLIASSLKVPTTLFIAGAFQAAAAAYLVPPLARSVKLRRAAQTA